MAGSWGAERIRGELLKRGIALSRRAVQRYRRRAPAGRPSPSWRAFLATHRPQLRAADRSTVQTLGFRTLYVLLLVAHDRRELVHVGVTAHPTAAWVRRQLIRATPWGRTPRFLIRDRDAVCGRDFVGRARHPGIETVLAPVRAPRANAIAERVVGTLRRECPDHIIVLNEAHPRAVPGECVRYHNAERPHRTLGLDTPVQRTRRTTGPVRASPVLGGLHDTYERAA
jgi:transposase InsO family protein